MENFKKSVNGGNEFGALLTDISKAFDFIDHKLLIVKIFWYLVLPTALSLIHTYLINRSQRLIVDSVDEVARIRRSPRISARSIII